MRDGASLDGPVRGVVLYSDPNCPFCYALGERLVALGLAGCVEWRGVQHAPELPVPMADAGARMRAELAREVDAVRALAPEVPVRAPRGKPNTCAAIRAAAWAYRHDAERAHAFTRALYRAFWTAGRDLSDPAVLDQIGRECGITGPIKADGDAAEAWERGWWRTGVRAVPALVRVDGGARVGLPSAAELEAFLTDGERPTNRGHAPAANQESAT